MARPVSQPDAAAADTPLVRVEVKNGSAQAISYDVPAEGFLIGSVAGCDLRLPGTSNAPVVCLITPCPDGPSLRRLAPAQAIRVNGGPLQTDRLRDGDRLVIADAELHIRCLHRQGVVECRSEYDQRLDELEAYRAELETQKQQLESEQASWYRRRDEMEAEYQKYADRKNELAAEWEAVERQQEEQGARQTALEEQAAALAAREEALAQTRKELAELRDELHARYRERRDRLAGLQESVNLAARKVQEHKRNIDAEGVQFESDKQVFLERRAEIEAKISDFEFQRQAVFDLRRELETQQQECRDRECQIAEERAQIDKDQEQYQEDLVRLDRARAELERREQEHQSRLQELEGEASRLEQEKHDHAEQDKQLNEWHGQLCSESDRLSAREQELEAAGVKLDERTAMLEEQQAALVVLRTKLEQTREEQRQQDHQLAEGQLRQQEQQAELKSRIEEAQRLRAELEVEKLEVAQQRQHIDERTTLMNQGMQRLKEIGETLREEEEKQRQRARELEAEASRLVEEHQLFQARVDQVHDMQERIAAERIALREREVAIVQSEQARQTLQEQLRRRSEELTERQQAIEKQQQQHEAELQAVEARRAQLEEERQQAEERLAHLQQEIERKRTELDSLQSDLAVREESVQRQLDKLKQSGRGVALARKTITIDQADWQAHKEAEQASLAEAQAQLEQLRNDTAELHRQLPDLELNAQAALERLHSVREQLGEHLAEMHAYARLRHEDLEGLRVQVQEEANRLQQQVGLLHKGRDEYRHAVAGFRQQIISWQGQVADLRRSLATDETRLERRQAEMDQAARAIGETSARLAHQAEELETKEREVVEKRNEVGRHLHDMRDWYKEKLRELAVSCENRGEEPAASAELLEEPRNILPIADEVDPGDRQLGDLLLKFELIDAETLDSLLAEARRQRRSLRQVLLTSGHVSVYQMALIEAGNLDGLVLGPVRVIDRLRVTEQESVYRVFDPRRGPDGFALLRHLTEAEMMDAVHPDEFRQRFSAAAAVRDPHIVATYEVLDIMSRPAALQELIAGLPAVEWQELASAPGVCYRLLTQAACGLNAAHQAGLVHGRLDPTDFFLTSEGHLKISGFGEPAWLHPDADVPEASSASDLAALGRTAADWLVPSPRAKASRSKALKPLLEIIQKLSADSDELRYPSAGELLEELENLSSKIPAHADAWQRLLDFVRQQLADTGDLRRSA